MSEPMKRKHVYLNRSQVEKLGRRSRETGAPASELIRRAIDEYLAPLATKRKPLQKGVHL
jgi:hypothetical protein